MAEKSLRQLIIDMDTKFTGEFSKVNGRLDGIDVHLGVVDTRFDGIDTRLDGMDLKTEARFDTMDHRFDESDRRFDMVTDLVLDIKRDMVTKAELEEVKTDVSVVKKAVTHLSKQLNDHIKDKRVHVNM